MRDAAVFGTGHVRNAMVPRESLVQERIVRGPEVRRRAVLAKLAFDKQRGFTVECSAQSIIEFGNEGAVAPHGGQLIERESCVKKSSDQRRGPGVSKHPPHLPLQRFRIVECAFGCGVVKRSIGRGVPNQPCEAHRTLEIGRRARRGYRIRIQSPGERRDLGLVDRGGRPRGTHWRHCASTNDSLPRVTVTRRPVGIELGERDAASWRAIAVAGHTVRPDSGEWRWLDAGLLCERP